MHHVSPKVYLIGKTELDRDAARQWLDGIGANEYVMPPEEAGTSAEQLVTLAGKRCYMSFVPGLNPNVTKVRQDLGEFIENILKVGHGSVVEHAMYSFAIENVSRVFTGEMNRHRAGVAISEGSMRYIRFEDIPYWIPSSIQHNESDTPEIKAKKNRSRMVFAEAFNTAERLYAELFDIWKSELAPESKFHLKKQITSMMRRIIPMGVATGGVWSLNLRALRHVFHMRCDEAAEEEICLVASMMLEKMIETEPNFFKDFYKDEKGFWRAKYVKV